MTEEAERATLSLSTLDNDGENYEKSGHCEEDESGSTKKISNIHNEQEESVHTDEQRVALDSSHNSERSAETVSEVGSQASLASTGVVQRPLCRHAVSSRSAATCETGVGMDGSLHQASLADEKDRKKRRVFLGRACSCFAILCLVAAVLFFAVQIGPFHVLTNTGFAREADCRCCRFKHRVTDDVPPDFPNNLNVAFKNWRVPFDKRDGDLPILWNYGLSGGVIVEEAFGKCLGLVQAGSRARFDSKYYPQFETSWYFEGLRVLKTKKQLFVNVDLASEEGIERAARLGLAESHVAEVAYTPLLYPSTLLFHPRPGHTVPDVQGRLVIVFRDPIERALSRYEEVKRIQPGMSLLDYTDSPTFQENNPLTRALLGLPPDSPLKDSQLRVAQQIVGRKVLVGIYDRMQETLENFQKFFLWYDDVDSFQQGEIFFNWHVGEAYPPVSECDRDVEAAWRNQTFQSGDDYASTEGGGYNRLLAQHRFDILVYKFAVQLFNEQKLRVEDCFAEKQG